MQNSVKRSRFAVTSWTGNEYHAVRPGNLAANNSDAFF